MADGLKDVVPYPLEAQLRGLSALFEGTDEKFNPYAVRDGDLITGQNPASNAKMPTLMLQALVERAHKAA